MKDDVISRQAAIEAMEGTNWYHIEDGRLVCGANSKTKEPLYKAKDVYRVLGTLPAIEPRRGKWERHATYHGDDTSGFTAYDWRCSACSKMATVNEWVMYDLTDFCPNCGADMREEDHT